MSLRGLGSLRSSEDGNSASHANNAGVYVGLGRRTGGGFSGAASGGGSSLPTGLVPRPPQSGGSSGVSSSVVLGGSARRYNGQSNTNHTQSTSNADDHSSGSGKGKSSSDNVGYASLQHPTGNPRHGRNGYGLDLAALLANLEVDGSSNAKNSPASQQPPAQQHANTARKLPRKGSATSSGPQSARIPRVQSGKTRTTITLDELPTPGSARLGSAKRAHPSSLPPSVKKSEPDSPNVKVANPLTGGSKLPFPPAPEANVSVASYEKPKESQPSHHQAPMDPISPGGPGGPSSPQSAAAVQYDRPSSLATVAKSEATSADPAVLIDKDGKLGRMTSTQALDMFESVMSRYEKKEVLDYEEVYFIGAAAVKIEAPVPNGANYGYDDERGDYVVTPKDHIAYRYEVIGELGKGSFGQVLKVQDHKKNSLCALKIIRNKKRFHQQAAVEIRILDHLRSRDTEDRSCTVRMLNYFKFRSHTIITFEMHSMNLYELTKLNRYQPFAPALIKRFTAQILVAMSYMWREHIVHCDLKPENILLKYEHKTSIKLIDFGSSCFENERIYTYIQSRFYRAPEIILGLSYGRPIDTWSLGCIICEMQMGYPIFPGENEKEQLLCIMEVLGVPPQRLVDRSPRKKDFFDTNGQPKIFANSRNKIRKPATKDIFRTLRTEDSSFVDFVLCFLQWEPSERITPTEAMRHPWVAECFQQDTVDAPSQSVNSRLQAHNPQATMPVGGTGSSSGSAPSSARSLGSSRGRLGSAGVLPPARQSGVSKSNLPDLAGGGTATSRKRKGSAQTSRSLQFGDIN